MKADRTTTVAVPPEKFSYNGHEVIHWTEDGRECAFCCAVLVGPQAASHPKRVSVVMVSDDPCSTWITGRAPTCDREAARELQMERRLG